MTYHYGSGRPVVACGPCVRGLVRGYARAALPAPVRDAVAWRGGVWETDATEVLDGRRVDLSTPGRVAMCALCGQVREVVERATARVSETPFPWASDVPEARCSSTCLEPPDLGPPTVADALEEIAVTEAAVVRAGVAWRGARLPAGPESQPAWLYLGQLAAARVVPAGLRAPVVGGGSVDLPTAADVSSAVSAVGSALVRLRGASIEAREVAAAVPTALSVIVAALRAPDPLAAIDDVSEVAAVAADPSDPPEERAEAARLLGLGGAP